MKHNQERDVYATSLKRCLYNWLSGHVSTHCVSRTCCGHRTITLQCHGAQFVIQHVIRTWFAWLVLTVRMHGCHVGSWNAPNLPQFSKVSAVTGADFKDDVSSSFIICRSAWLVRHLLRVGSCCLFRWILHSYQQCVLYTWSHAMNLIGPKVWIT